MRLKRKYAKISALLTALAASWIPGCATSPPGPTIALCAAPSVTRCRPPERPGELVTQADLLRAYVGALAAWAECDAQVSALIEYYETLEKKNENR